MTVKQGITARKMFLNPFVLKLMNVLLEMVNTRDLLIVGQILNVSILWEALPAHVSLAFMTSNHWMVALTLMNVQLGTPIVGKIQIVETLLAASSVAARLDLLGIKQKGVVTLMNVLILIGIHVKRNIALNYLINQI